MIHINIMDHICLIIQHFKNIIIIPGIFPRYFFMHFFALKYTRVFVYAFIRVLQLFLACFYIVWYLYIPTNIKRLKNDFNAPVLRAEQIHPAPARNTAGGTYTRSGATKKTRSFFRAVFFTLCTHARTRGIVAKGLESRYSRARLALKVAGRCAKKSLACAKKSKSR